MSAEVAPDQKAEQQSMANWAPISGRWRRTGSSATYLGPVDPASQSTPSGVLLAGPKMRNGRLSTSVLRKGDDTAGGVVLGFSSLSNHYVLASVGAHGKAYAIHEYRPETGQRVLAGAGHVENLVPDQLIRLTAELFGQTVRLQVDGVDVLSHVLSSPLESYGCGLRAYGGGPVEFSDTTLISSPPKLFVIMPFAEPFDTLYREVIKEVAGRMGFDVVRVDEVFGPGQILDDIQRQIEESNVVIAEISTHNANVFYELGYAHALRKPAVLLVRRQDGDKMPFDIRGYRAIFYDDSIGGKRTVERTLEQHLQAIQRDRIS